MKNRRNLLVLLMLAVLVSIVPALHVSAADSLIEKACLVTDVGKVNDGTFNQFAYEGGKKAADDFGLDFTYIETTAQTDYEKNIQTCLDEGYQAIVTVGFFMSEATTKLSAANPDRYFIGVDQFVGPDANGNPAPSNYVGLQFREDQAGFLAGALAAQMSKSGTVAGVYGIDVPAVKKYRFGFEQGAAYINPTIKTLGTYVPSFVDAAGGASAAEQFLGEGADVIFGAGGQTGSGGIVDAAKKGAYVIGVDQDEWNSTFGKGTAEGSDKVISSAMKRVDNAVYGGIKALVDGGADFAGGGNITFSAANDGVGYAPKHDSDVPDAVTAKLDTILAGLKDGSIWTGVDPVAGDLLPLASDALAANGLTKLAAAIDAAGLTQTMNTSTVADTAFAPNDDAFNALPAGDLDKWMADPAALSSILLYHVIPGAHVAADIAGMGSMDVVSLAGTSIKVTVGDDGSVTLNGSAKVVQADILTRTGVIHVIDKVLTPPAK